MVRVAEQMTHEASVAHVSSLAAIVHHVRSDAATTRPEISRLTGLGRNVVAQRVGQLMELGLLEDDGPGTSVGGRPARSLTFRADAGRVLIASLGHSAMTLGIADLAGHFIDKRHIVHDIAAGPESALTVAESILDDLVADQDVQHRGLAAHGPRHLRTGGRCQTHPSADRRVRFRESARTGGRSVAMAGPYPPRARKLSAWRAPSPWLRSSAP